MPPAPHPPDNPRYLITGAKGFIGSWIVKNLVERGERPWIFDQDPASHRLEAILNREAFEMLQFVRGDITDFEALDRAVADLGISRLFHLAALQVPLCAADPRRCAEVNVVGTLNVSDAARRRTDQVRRVAYARPAAVCGPEECSRGRGVPAR